MSKHTYPSARHGALAPFTLIELLVVVAIIAVLAAMLLPALGKAKLMVKRTQCANNEKQFLTALHMYADEADNKLPSGKRDIAGETCEHLSVATGLALLKYCGNNAILGCPVYEENNTMPFASYTGSTPNLYGIGYYYLGGHTAFGVANPGTGTSAWTSPLRLTDEPGLTLLTDITTMNTYAPWNGAGAQHAAGGYIWKWGNIPAPLTTLRVLGANNGLLDGSVSFVPSVQMRKYAAYNGGNIWGYW